MARFKHSDDESTLTTLARGGPTFEARMRRTLDSPVAALEEDVEAEGELNDEGEEQEETGGKRKRRFAIEYIEDGAKRAVCQSKRIKGLKKKAEELSILTGSEVLVVVLPESRRGQTYFSHGFDGLLRSGELLEAIKTGMSPEVADADEARSGKRARREVEVEVEAPETTASAWQPGQLVAPVPLDGGPDTTGSTSDAPYPFSLFDKLPTPPPFDFFQPLLPPVFPIPPPPQLTASSEQLQGFQPLPPRPPAYAACPQPQLPVQPPPFPSFPGYLLPFEQPTYRLPPILPLPPSENRTVLPSISSALFSSAPAAFSLDKLPPDFPDHGVPLSLSEPFIILTMPAPVAAAAGADLSGGSKLAPFALPGQSSR
ncbi:hypothetical protein JCM10213_004402 [Rhodosporidiobolus nylandii]